MAPLPSELADNEFVQRYRAWLGEHYLLAGMNHENLTNAGFFKNYLFFYALPYLFSEKLVELEPGLVRRVQSWSFFTALFVRHLDVILDGCPSEHLFNQQRRVLAFFAESDAQLRELFAADHPFWPEFKVLHERYFGALEMEVSLGRDRRLLTKEEYVQLAIDKACISEGVPLVLCHLAHDFDNFAPLRGALQHFNVSLQILDDIPDVWEDEADGRWNYFRELFNAFLVRENIVVDKTPGNPLLRKYYYLSGVPAEGYRQALWHLDQIRLCLDGGRLSDALEQCVESQSNFCRKRCSQIEAAVSDAFQVATASAC